MFSRRSGKVLALCRTAMAALYTLAVCFSLGLTGRFGTLPQTISLVYLGITVVLLAIAWRDWWLDCRLAPLVQALDILAFMGALYLTDRPHGTLTNPFLVFGTFLLVVALVRWGTVGVATTGLALLGAVVVPSLLLALTGIAPDLLHLVRGLAGFGVISLLMLWLASRERGPRVVTLRDPAGAPGARRTEVLASALGQATALMRARGAALAVAWGEEPWIDVLIEREGRITSTRQGPEALAEALSGPPGSSLFDVGRHRRITLRGGMKWQFEHRRFDEPLAEHCGITEGIVATFASVSSQGQLMVWGMPDMAIDDLWWMDALVREIGQALDREEMAALAKTSAVVEIRNALARDLHDSVVQFLAGTMFRLDALRRRLREGHDPEDEILAMRDALRREQAHLRMMIDRLRRGEDGDRATDLGEELRSLIDEIATHWKIAVTFAATGGAQPVPIHLVYELRQMVREAVANAARHGQCSAVDITLRNDGPTLVVTIADDGIGFPDDGRFRRPRSISERVAALGGRVDFTVNDDDEARPGARLEIELPARLHA